MRFDIDDDVAELRRWFTGDPQFVAGACWALSRVSGVPAEIIEQKVMGIPPLQVEPGAPTPAVIPVPPPEDAPLGIYPGIGPITKEAAPLVPADMTQPPTPPSEDSMAAAFERAQENGDPLVLPMDPETLAEVEAELDLARQRSNPEA